MNVASFIGALGASLKRAHRVFALVAVLTLALSSAALAVTATDGANPAPAPTVSSDRADYAPGDTVVLTGENWRPGERVRIQVRAEEGYDWSRDVEVTAAADGTIRDEFQLPDYYVPRYYVTATGETSGTATTTFTDGNIRVLAGGPAGTTFTLKYTRYSTTNCTGTPSGSTTTVNNVNSTTGTTINSVNNGQSVLLEAAPRSDQGGEFVNFTSSSPFTVTAQGPRFICVQGFGGNGTRDYTANYAAPANLSITKNGPATVVTGQNFSYTLMVNNAQGAGPANDVTVTDTLPAGVTLNGPLPAGCSSSGTNPVTVTCNLGRILGGGTDSRTINVTAPNSPGTISNQARVSSPNDLSSSDSNTVTTTVQQAADLSITKSDNPDPVLVNGNFSYTLSVSNAVNAGTAEATRITDTLPAGVTLNGSLPAGCSSSGTNPVTVTCDLGSVAPGQTVSRTINVTAPGTPGTLDNRARVTSSTDPTPNDSNIEQTTVVAEADLTINKTDSEDPVLVNGNFSYTLTVSNAQGAGTATGVVARDTLPEGVTLNGSLPGDCTSTTGTDGRITVTCNLGTIGPGQTVGRTINVSAGGTPRTLSNTATVSSPRDRTDASDTEETTVIPVADLSLTKADSPDPVNMGQNLTYTLTATNNGPSPATNAVIRDTLPASAQFVSASEGCAESGGVVTCNLGGLANGATATREIVVRPTAAGTLSNMATVSSDTRDSNDANNSAAAITTVRPAADLSIRKEGPANATNGQPFEYRLIVTNDGPSAAQNVVVTDDLPAGVTYNDGASSGTCDPIETTADPNDVRCTLANLAANDSATFIINVTPTQAENLSNRASVTSDTTDPNAANNTSNDVTTTVSPAADLSISKSGPATATNGQAFNYTITVTNNGPNTAQNLVVTDDLPDGLQYNDAASTPSCEEITSTPDPNDVRCTLSSLAPNDQATFTINVTPTQTGQLSNTATVSSDTTDPNNGNNTSDPVSTTVNPAADLSISKDGPEEAFNGEPFDYTVTVTNEGPDATQNVVVEDDLPEGVTYNDAQSTPSCEPITSTPDTNDIRCTLADPLPANQSATFTISVTPTQPGQLSNQATVSSDTTDPTPANNTSDPATTSVQPAADLSIGKEGPESATNGQPFEYTITVTNEGPDAAQNVVVTDDLPDGLQYNDGTSSPQCEPIASTPDPNDARCTLANLAANQSQMFTINVTPTQTGTMNNTATVSSATEDPDNANNTSNTVSTTVNPAADLSISKEGPATATNGQPFNYTLTVTNNGPNTAQNVIVTDDLPAGVTYNDGASTPSCEEITSTPDPNDVRCTLASLPATAGQNQATFTINVTPTQTGQLSNTATVSSDTTDPNDANNQSDPATTQVQSAAAADLSIRKEGQATATNGQSFEYQLIVTNNGPDAAQNVVVTDDLPDGLQYNDAASTPSCEEVSGTADPNDVRCTLASMAAGETQTFIINVTPTETANLSNSASVSSDTTDPNNANNTSDPVNTTVNPAADLSIQKADSSDPATYGGAFTYRLTVTNNGPNDAQNVVVEDDLPDGLTYNDGSSSPQCDPIAGTADPNDVRCTLASLASGTSQTFTISVTPTQTGQLSNAATVSSDTADTNQGNNSATETTTVNGANLSITKSDSSDPVGAGENFTYTLRVTNPAGGAAAGDVEITDQLPDGVTFVEAPGCQPPDQDRVVRCDLGTVADGQTVERQITVKAPNDPTTLSNTARVSSPNDPDASNNSATEQTTVSASANVSIEKTGPATVTDEDVFDYTITVRNGGPSTAQDVSVTDQLPAGIEFVGFGPDTQGCQPPGQDRVVRCDLGTVAPGGQETVVIQVRAKDPGQVSNTAEVQSPTDTTPGNNSSTAETRIGAAADLSIDKQAPAEVTDGQRFSYALDVTNGGPSDATGVVVEDDLPAGITFEPSGTDPRCQYDADPRTVSCELGTLANGGATEVQISVRATQPGVAENVASVTGTEPDPDANNNTDTVTTQVSAAPNSADLSITKSGPATATNGQPFDYTLILTNNGPDAAQNVIVTDDLPDGVTYDGSQPPGACSLIASTPDPNDVECTLANLAANDSATFTINVTPTQAGQLSNRATVTSDTPDPNEQNNSDAATTLVQQQQTSYAADLSLRKDARPRSVTVGKKLTYTLIVKNEGPDTATGVIIRDRLPRNVAFVSTSKSCKNSRGTVTCNVGSMADGTSVTKKIVVRAKKAGHLRNTATVTGTVNDPRSANNSDTEHTTAKAANGGGSGGNGGGNGGGGNGGKGGGGGEHDPCSKGAKGGKGKTGGKHPHAHGGSCHGKGRVQGS